MTSTRSQVISTVSQRRDEERNLAEQAGSGDHAAFTVLFERYKGGIYRYAYLMTGDREVADDVYQEVFINFYKACRRGTTMFNVPAYLFRSVRNLATNDRRHRGRLQSIDDMPDLADDGRQPDFDMRAHLQRAIAVIAPQYREAFLLFEVEGYTYAEISHQLDVSLDVVRNRIFRAKKALQRILAPVVGVRDDW